MKSAIFCAIVAAALVGAAPAADTYLEVFGGANVAPDLEFRGPADGADYEMDTGYSYGASLGWNVTPAWSLEAEIAYNKNAYSCCNRNNTSLLNISLNGIYNFSTTGSLTPYIGAGIGYGQVEWEGDGDPLEDWTLTYKLIAGARVALSESIDLFGEYNFVAAAQADDGSYRWDYRSHILSAGLRFSF